MKLKTLTIRFALLTIMFLSLQSQSIYDAPDGNAVFWGWGEEYCVTQNEIVNNQWGSFDCTSTVCIRSYYAFWLEVDSEVTASADCNKL